MPAIQTGPVWKPVADARVQFAPVSGPAVRRARAAYFEALPAEREEGDLLTPEQAAAAVGAFCRSLLCDGILDWEGVTDSETGALLPVSPENIAAAALDPDFGVALSTAYAAPVWQRELEKNASSPSRAGATAGSKAKSDTARRTTGNASAKPAPAAKAASRTPTGKAKAPRRRPAPSSVTPAKRRKAKRSGR